MFRLIFLLFFSVSTFANPPTFTVGTDPLIDISQTGTGLSLSDDGIKNVAIGFDFTFGNNTYNNVTVAMNGFLTFNSVTQFNSDVIRRRNYLSEQFPSAGYNNSIKPLHSDFIRRSSGNQSPYYQTFGNTSDTNQYFVVMWDNVSEYSNGRKSTFEVILYETTNDIKFLYDEINIDNHDASIGLQYSMTNYVEYLWYDDTNSTSLELEEFSLTTAVVVDESFTNLSSECLTDQNYSDLCDTYNLSDDIFDLTEETLDFSTNFTGFSDDLHTLGYDEDEINFGFSFTLDNDNEYFLPIDLEGVEDFSIIDYDTLTLEGNENEYDLNYIDHSDTALTSDILLGTELDELEFDYFSVEELDELPIIIDINTHDEIHYAELEIIEEYFDEEEIQNEEETTETIHEEEEELHEESVEENTEEPEEETTEEQEENRPNNSSLISQMTEQGVRVSQQNGQSQSDTTTSNVQNNNQTISSTLSFEGVGVSNQIAQETQQQNTVLSSINIVPINVGTDIAAPTIATVEVTTIDIATQIENSSTQVLSISEAQELQESIIESNLATVEEQSQIQESTGQYSETLQDTLLGIMAFVPSWSNYLQMELQDRETFYQPRQIYTNVVMYDNNNGLASLVGTSNDTHYNMLQDNNLDFFRSNR